MLFSIVDVQICIPTYRVSFAPNPNQQLFLVVLKNNHPDRCEIFHCGFDLHSLDISDAQHLLYIYIYITISKYSYLKNILTYNGCINTIVSELINT